MKEGKAKTTAKKKTTKRPSNTKNTNKVKEVKTEPLEENFLEEDDDKRLIVFIAIAILIIVGTIIGLLVGCQKEKDKEPEKPEGDDIVIPVEPDNKDDKEKEYNREKRLPVVRKVTKKTTKKSSSNSNESSEDETDNSHTVVYYLNDTSENITVEDGETAPEYVPDGYNECSYYTDSELTTPYEFGSVTEDINIYMSCSVKTYSIVYNVETSNPTSYTVEDQDTTLVAAESETGVFEGWFTSEEDGTKITTLNKDIISYADSNNTIYLYGRFTSSDVVVDPTTDSVEPTGLTPDEDGAKRALVVSEELEEEQTEEEEFVGNESIVDETPELEEKEDSMVEEPDTNEPEDEVVLETTIIEEPENPIIEEVKEESQEPEKEEVKETPKDEKPVTTEPVTPTVEKVENEEPKKEEVKVEETKKEKPVVQKEEKKEEVKEEPEEATPVNEE